MDAISAENKSKLLQTRRNILDHFSNSSAVITKSMTESEFNNTYKRDTHEVYTVAALREFEKSLRAEIGAKEVDIMKAIDSATEGLEKVNVIPLVGKAVHVWVRERKKN